MAGMRFFVHSSDVNKGKLFNHIYRVGVVAPGASTNTDKYEHTYDLIRSALNGWFDVNQEEFNHAAYEYQSRMNDGHNKRKEVVKKSNIVEDDLAEDEKYGYGDVKAGVALRVSDYEYSRVDSTETIHPGIDELFSVRDRIRRELGIDIVVSLEASLSEDPDAIVAMRELVNKDSVAREIIMDLLESVSELDSSGGEEFNFIEELKSRRLK